MTPYQHRRFVEMMQLGWAMGCEHVYECYTNWLHHMPSVLPYADGQTAIQGLQEAMLAFLHGTASGPDDPISEIDVQQMHALIQRWYDRRREAAGLERVIHFDVEDG